MSDLHVVLGATGAIGSAVVAELTAGGHRVRAVSRGAGSGPGDFRADVTTTEGAIAACAGAAVVYQCAQPEYGRWAEEFPGLTRTILTGVEAAGAKLVMADNLYVYGPVDGPMTEDRPHAATNPKGRARAEVDRLILDAHRSGRIRATLGRASDYYGPGGVNTVIGPTVFAAALAGKTARWIGDLDQPHTVAYLPDIAAGLVTLGERAEADGRAWHLPTAEAVTGREFLGLVWAAAGGEPRIAGLSRGAQRLIGLFNPTVRELGETWYQRDRPFVADDSDFRRTFESVKVTPHTEGVAATLEWYRRNPA
ncbi:NAD-dependent epimerase/dehydratase family protein [Dactylosporangium sp. AC04546]|uniref:NAD-dependent epimerase/dehydratase family protein n=1 Tax=Dactylosporangium sp. AC04546 TaxID=2862460 RepID=UPI001EDEC5AA|nr:NAD-dependent epimerase/dehydratase family protein [Dactylosporangium sp. AC04546]WVK87170.1 NAD-dependent epimerase/dehydratase family protein [Dactylosporangium sp. AC04546]